MPNETNVLPKYVLERVKAVMIAIGSRKYYYSELHLAVFHDQFDLIILDDRIGKKLLAGLVTQPLCFLLRDFSEVQTDKFTDARVFDFPNSQTMQSILNGFAIFRIW